MLSERNSVHPAVWALLVSIVAQMLLVAYTYGQITQHVAGIEERLIRIERALDARRAPDPPGK